MTAEHVFNFWPEVDYLRTNDEAEAGPSRMPPFEFQSLANDGSCIDLSALYSSPNALRYYAGEPSGENWGETPQTHIEFKMTRPIALNEKPIEHRQDNQVALEISVAMLFDQANIPWDSINVSEKPSVRRSMVGEKRASLDLTLEVCGATTRTAFRVACDKCATRTSLAFPNQSLFAFAARDGLVEIKGGKARVVFRFLCRPGHHGTTDTEYQLSARLSHNGRTLGQYMFPNWFRIVSHLKRRKNTPPATIPLSIGAPEVMEFSDNVAESQALYNARASGSGSSRTDAGGHEVAAPPQPLTTSSQSLPEIPASTPRPDEGSVLPVNEQELPVLLRVNPRRGPTSGGDEIVLIVSNLPQPIKLYARFGSKISSTAHIAPGVLLCNLPAAAHPGVVDVTLCLTATIDGEPYGNSLASFEYEADSTRAVSLLMKLLNGKVLLEAMPLIQRLLQQNVASHGAGGQGGPDDSHTVLPSSLSEQAFVDILSALEPLPDFNHRLAMVNEQGQTLLHLAVHLQYRTFVQKLIHWGIDLSVKDVNKSTALDAAYICDDRFAIALLEQGRVEPFALSQGPTELTAPTTSADGDTAMDTEETAPQSLDDVPRVHGQHLPPDVPIPMQIQRPSIDPIDKKDNLVEVCSERESSNIVQSAAETQDTPLESIDEYYPSKTASRAGSGDPTTDPSTVPISTKKLNVNPSVSQLHARYVQFPGFTSATNVHQLTLHRYQTNQALLQEEMNIVELLLDPFHGVPSEILEDIFLWAVEGSEMERRRRSVERGEHPNAKAWPAPFALAAVCRHWKILVCSNPRLWQYLVLDVRAENKYYSTPVPMIHERIYQHLKYSHNLPLDITIIAWGDRLRESLVPMVLQPLQAGNLARRGLRRLELVTGGRNDIEAGYTRILAGVPPAQHLALVRVWPPNTEIRVPASFCTRLTRIDAYDAVFRLEDPCASATQATLFKTDHARLRTLLAQTPSLERLTIVGLTHTDISSYSRQPVETLPVLRTVALRITDLTTHQASSKLALAVQLPALRKLILLNMPDMILSDDWRGFVDAYGAHVDEVEVRAVIPHAARRGEAPAYLAHLAQLPALTSLRLVGDCALPILGAMALRLRPISRGMQKPPALHGITQLSVSDCTLPRRALQIYGWYDWNPSATWVWRRKNAEDIKVTLERVHVEEMHMYERSFTN